MAVTLRAAIIVTWHVTAVPLHAPLQLAKLERASGVAVRATTVPRLYGSLQSAPQLMPAGEEARFPLPEPAVVTVSEYMARAKVAVADLAALMVTWQEPAPEQAPLQTAKAEPAAAAAERVTTAPES